MPSHGAMKVQVLLTKRAAGSMQAFLFTSNRKELLLDGIRYAVCNKYILFMGAD